MKNFIDCCRYWGPIGCTLFGTILVTASANIVIIIWSLIP